MLRNEKDPNSEEALFSSEFSTWLATQRLNEEQRRGLFKTIRTLLNRFSLALQGRDENLRLDPESDVSSLKNREALRREVGIRQDDTGRLIIGLLLHLNILAQESLPASGLYRKKGQINYYTIKIKGLESKIKILLKLLEGK